MEVVQKGLVPGVKHCYKAQLASQMSAAKLQQRFRYCFKEDVAYYSLIRQRYRVKFVRQSED